MCCVVSLCSWDAELFGTYGWVEVVGHADRSAFDLRVHSAKSKVELVAQETFDAPRLLEVATVKANWALLGKTYGKQPSYKLLQEFIKAAADDKDEAIRLKDELARGSAANQACADAVSTRREAGGLDSHLRVLPLRFRMRLIWTVAVAALASLHAVRTV